MRSLNVADPHRRLLAAGRLDHPMHLHGFLFTVVAQDGGAIPESARHPVCTQDVAPGGSFTTEFTPDSPGTWLFHCHTLGDVTGPNGTDAGMITPFISSEDGVAGGSVPTVNAGSTNLKLRLVDPAGASEDVASLDDAPGDGAAVGHRIVHGGPGLTAPALLHERTAAQLEDAAALAPLPDRPAIDAIAAARAALPDVPHVPVPDTAFHATIPAEARTYAVPARWREEWGVRRYGFHGLSVAWASERAAAMLGGQRLQLVVCHLGGGASVTAVCDGRSVDTTMGFGPLEGLVIATRSGTVDPDVPLHLVLRRGVPPAEVERELNEESGLRALAGTGDMRRSRRWRPRSAAWTRSSSRAASAREGDARAPRPPAGWRSSASPTRTSRLRAPGYAPSWCARARRS